ncbi:hypothetical protein M9H77_04030 [Catharanthus roseus]|uniref:Uncharacterized protein n=1 Tax=Catharanthus roseus TaxID=4058 RepID=A0ACC0CD50_CATRO|nr:hypothetical protein M9H77_04030 [Catharanthus roseus]
MKERHYQNSMKIFEIIFGLLDNFPKKASFSSSSPAATHRKFTENYNETVSKRKERKELEEAYLNRGDESSSRSSKGKQQRRQQLAAGRQRKFEQLRRARVEDDGEPRGAAASSRQRAASSGEEQKLVPIFFSVEKGLRSSFSPAVTHRKFAGNCNKTVSKRKERKGAAEGITTEAARERSNGGSSREAAASCARCGYSGSCSKLELRTAASQGELRRAQGREQPIAGKRSLSWTELTGMRWSRLAALAVERFRRGSSGNHTVEKEKKAEKWRGEKLKGGGCLLIRAASKIEREYIYSNASHHGRARLARPGILAQ